MIDARVILSALFTIVLCGCNSSPAKFPDYLELNTIRKEFVRTHEQMARKYEATGALNEARREWQLIDAIPGPKTSLARVEIARLERKVALRLKEHLNAAHRAEKRAKYKTAQLELLKALALKPDNAIAINRLKEIAGRRSYARLALVPAVSDVAKSETDLYTAPDIRLRGGKGKTAVNIGSSTLPMPSNEPVDEGVRKGDSRVGTNNIQQGRAHLSRKEYKQALHYFQLANKKGEGSQAIVDKYLAKTRQALANQHYDQGVIAFRAARYDKAINEFAKALEYAPKHKKARFYQSSAKVLQGQ